ncbi:MAG: hypothetical protein JWN74_3549 [Acidobacteriaceae bacterium]|nr:hypothetical protein [Acidobacteriaceae bacterium]
MWFRRHDLEVLPLPNPFLADLLRSVARRRSGVEPTHYRKLIEMVSTASDFEAFIKATAGTVWRDVNRADEIHNAELDRELAALGTLAKKNLGSDVARRLSRQFGVPGCHPNPVIVAQKLSAALEFLQSCMKKVKDGANPRKNNAGLYTDFQLLLYLGSPDFVFLTREDFRSDIKISPQRNRIVDLDSLRP